MFEFLFKYPVWAYERGEVKLGVSGFGLSLALVLAAAAIAVLVTYGGLGRLRRRDRAVLIALRAVGVLLLLLALVRPVLTLAAAVPQQNVVGVLLDDSQSMRTVDVGEESRSAVVHREFDSPESPLMRALSERFVVRLFRFSSGVHRIADARELAFDGTQSRIGDALRRARDELAGMPVSGLVVVSDGADTTGATLADTVLSLKANAVPVFTVGLGQDAIARDIQIGPVTTPRHVLLGTTLVVEVAVTHRGFSGASLPLNVESDGQILASEQVTLRQDGESAAVRLRFTAETPGSHIFRFRVPPQLGEAIVENNMRDALIQVDERREKILQVEGEPRFEVKFARNAVEPDEQLQLVLLQRTAENKFYRLFVDTPEELAAGFPRTREELFAYRGLVLGSLEASALTQDQLRMIAEFVDRRGGGLLVVGGTSAFGEGGYGGTPVGEALPVTLDGNRQDAGTVLESLKVQPTRAGLLHAVTRLAGDEGESAATWARLPEVTTVNRVGQVKPGGTALLSGSTEGGAERVVLAYHRYGRGKVIALTPQDLWLWQMHADVAVEDMTYETFWRQMMRWLVADVPDQVVVATSADRVERGEQIGLSVSVADRAFVPVNSAQVSVTIAAPSGKTTEMALQWVGERDGEYRASFVPDEDGTHEVRADAVQKGESVGGGVTTFRVAPSDAEAFDAAMRAPLLQRLAEETGGQFYTAETLSKLPDDLRYTERGVTVVEERDLWDMPALLFALGACLLGEWSFRRWRGLA